MPSNQFISLSAERGPERLKRAFAVVCSLLVGVLLLFGAISVAPAFAEDAGSDASAQSSEVEHDSNLALLAEQAGNGYYNEEYYHVALPEGESVTVNMVEHEKTSFDFTVSSDSFCTFTMKRSTDSYMMLSAFIYDDTGVPFEGWPVPKAGSSGPISLPAGKYHLEMLTVYLGSSNIDNVTVSFDTVPIKSGMIEREENNSPEQANELCASDIWGSLYIANALTTKPDVDCFKLVLEKPSHVELNLYNSGASVALSLTDGSGIPCVSTKTVLTSGTSYHGLIESDVFEPGTYYVCCESKKDSKAWGTTYLLTVNVSDIVHTVSFNANGGSEVEAQKVAHGAMAIAPVAPVKEGRTFAGWYSDSGLTKVYDFDTAVTGDLTLYAKWTPSKHAVTFVSNGGSAVKAQSVTYGSRASKPANPKKTGYTFKGWYTDKGCTKAYSFDSAVRADLTLYAKWAINAHTVTFESNGGSIVVGQTVKYGAKAAKPNDPIRVGHTFRGWYADSALKNAYNFDTPVKSDTTLWAKWEKVSSGSGQNPPTSFKDVPKGTWYHSWVTSAAQTGLMTGLKNDAGRYTGYFAPDDPLTRAQVATVIWRAAGGPSAGAAGFKDVKSGEWYTSAVAWCAQAGIVTGYTSGPDKGCFRPDRPVSRQELATMVWRFAKWCGISVYDPDQATFKSTTDWWAVDSYAVEPLVWTAAVGIMGGVDNGDGTYSLQPTGGATRAQAAKVFVVLTRDVFTGKVATPVAKYKVQFESNGGSAVKAQTVESGGKASKPGDPNRDDYKFKGWYTDKGLTKAYNFNTTVKSNVTLYAKWEKIPPVYCVLYSDGLLSLQRGADIDSSHGGVIGKWVGFGGSYSRPWDGYEEKVRNVVVRDPIELPADSSRLFSGLKNCTSMDVTKLNVSNVTNMSDMFEDCESLASLDVSQWDVSSATRIYGMFFGCSSLASLDVSGWDVSKVTDMRYVFGNCSRLADLDVSQWDVSSATKLGNIFANDRALTSLDVSGWNVSHATDLSDVFSGCSSLASLDVSQWDVSSATTIYGMFFGCSSLASLDVSGWDVSKVTDMRYVFGNCSRLADLDVSQWDVSSATKLGNIFANDRALTSLDVSGWNVSHATDLSDVFSGCSSLASLDVSQWDVSSATRMFGTFYGCESLTSLDVSGWDVSKVADMEYVFGACSNLISLNIAGWDTSGVEEADSFASYADALDKVTVGPKFTLGKYLPDGPWYDESGKSWDTVPSGVGGTFSKTRPSGNKTASEAPNLEEVDAPAGIDPEDDKNLADVAVTRGVTDSGLEYAMVPEGAVDAAGEAYVLDREYAELGGRYVGAGVYVTAYRGDSVDLALPAQIGDVDVVSADLSWGGDAQAGVPDPDGRTRLESLALERGCGLASLDASGSDVAGIELAGDEALGGLPALRFLDLSGTRVSSLDPTPMPALERLALRGCPLDADSLGALGAWSGATGLPADLEGAGVKAEPSEPEQPAEPEQPSEPAGPGQPGEPANSDQPSAPAVPGEPGQPAEPEQPSNPAEPAVPGESEQPAEPAIPDQPSEPSEPANPDQPEQSAEPVGPADSSEPVTSGDPAIPAELSESVDLGHISVLPTGVTRIEESAA